VTTHYLIEEFVDALAAHVPDRYRHAMSYFGLSATQNETHDIGVIVGSAFLLGANLCRHFEGDCRKMVKGVTQYGERGNSV
jgi:S-formylglutathione hydrolase FrmB